jgi:hypothetical protein
VETIKKPGALSLILLRELPPKTIFPLFRYVCSGVYLSLTSIENRCCYRRHDTYVFLETRIFDVTGGTKLMSATAGHLAWEHGYSLCYLDGHWDPKVGAAGLEQASQLRIYTNPSEQQGFEIRRHGIELYAHGHFVAAKKNRLKKAGTGLVTRLSNTWVSPSAVVTLPSQILTGDNSGWILRSCKRRSGSRA